LYVGLDLHSNNTTIGISDEEDRVVFTRKMPNDLRAIGKVLKEFQEQIVGVVVESTFNWYWLVDGLAERGFPMHLAHPAAIKQYSGIKHTDDLSDALFLAKLLRLKQIPHGHIFPHRERMVRDLLRKRLQLVHQRSTHILSFKSLFNRNLGEEIASNAIKMLSEEDLETMFKDPFLKASAQANIATMEFLGERIKAIENKLLKEVSERPAFALLQTVPGIGKIMALTILLETGEISRFKEVGKYASYCRCVKSIRKSNDKTKGSNNRKNGNVYLAWAFVEVAHFFMRYCPEAKVFYQRKKRQRNAAVATKALAHKLARACFYIMRDQIPFNPNKFFGTPIKKEGSSEPSRGLDLQPMAPIGQPAAFTSHLDVS
jgi:transposase